MLGPSFILLYGCMYTRPDIVVIGKWPMHVRLDLGMSLIPEYNQGLLHMLDILTFAMI